ncbi:hexosaminidase [Aquimarina sp. EL_43]|uniref:beta-N-acetylhexosaminidase n=1 Tax=unclassified Aquimarina TaxID=2627091 RepID=UPI001A226095|nr:MULTISPECIES: family 20 glycosylhydrolase [unclassified Aquimarina]MBG6131176.1 hexosaminidase [Aquimarina sp. EL_35]MBG6151635.1 hexosaminidase [Aquimarina sp. EL_32]MBG6169565.1 hexosaminidase [Aquimarina sp. EL_43]
MKNIKKIILIFVFIASCFHINAQVELSEKYDLMPWPKEITENGQKFIIKEDFTIAVNKDNINPKIGNATTKFLRRLSGRTGVFIDEGFATIASKSKEPSLVINYTREGKLELNEDESYELSVLNNQISLTAITDIGIIRGLETLLQLNTHTKTEYFFHGVNIKDAPRFPWRGLMIDVARHYEPLEVLKNNLDAMAAVKMNVFHWHLTEDQGFRVEVKSRPKFHQLASDGQYYTHEQIKELVAYASNLGIRVVPEFDIPGHATSWLVAYPEMASKDTIYKIERYAGIFNPTLDPTKEVTYEIITDVFSEIAPLFPDKYFHIGGDENEGKHWDENDKIQEFKKKNNIKDNHELQAYFNIKIQEILKEQGKIMMGWDEILQPTLPKDVVIHSWRGKEAMLKAAKQGYKTVLSKGYYIDLLKSIRHHYANEPISKDHGLTEEQLKNILGGEATMWGELVTPVSIDSRIWPRTAAIAEKLWSSSAVNDADNMLKRLESVNYRLEELGISHIRNRNVILRNISNNQELKSLINLTKICEPLKAYQRNKGGVEYKSYSPFTQFVDACNTDAIDAILFDKSVKKYLESNRDADKQEIIVLLNKWITNHTDFSKINNNPTLAKLEPLSSKLAELSSILKKGLTRGSINKAEHQKSIVIIDFLSKPIADTELVIIPAIKKLISDIEIKNVKP